MSENEDKRVEPSLEGNGSKKGETPRTKDYLSPELRHSETRDELLSSENPDVRKYVTFTESQITNLSAERDNLSRIFDNKLLFVGIAAGLAGLLGGISVTYPFTDHSPQINSSQSVYSRTNGKEIQVSPLENDKGFVVSKSDLVKLVSETPINFSHKSFIGNFSGNCSGSQCYNVSFKAITNKTPSAEQVLVPALLNRYLIETEKGKFTDLFVDPTSHLIMGYGVSVSEYCSNLPSAVPLDIRSQEFMKYNVKKFEQVCNKQPENVIQEIKTLYTGGTRK